MGTRRPARVLHCSIQYRGLVRYTEPQLRFQIKAVDGDRCESGDRLMSERENGKFSSFCRIAAVFDGKTDLPHKNVKLD